MVETRGHSIGILWRTAIAISLIRLEKFDSYRKLGMGKMISITTTSDLAVEPLPGGLIHTKLNRPPCLKDLVRRSRLTSQLDRDMDCVLAVICAPAGFGKTTLAASWLSRLERISSWITLDEQDDFHGFLRYLVAAINGLFPESLAETGKLLRESRLPGETRLITTLLNELDAIDIPFVLVLDDSHKLQDPRIWKAIGQLLQYPPKCLHLVMISRTNPPLNLSALRARGQLTELRMEDLRFNRAETVEILSGIADYGASDDVLDRLEAQNDGWPVGLRLIGLALRKAENRERFLASAWRYPTLREYLAAEVLSKLPDSITHALLTASIVDRFCSPLCRRLCKGHAGAADDLLDPMTALIDSGLLIIPLDDTGKWFRYHQVLRDLLKEELERAYSDEEISALHLSASEWLADAGYIEEAIGHALEAGHPRRAADILIHARDHIMNLEDRVRFSRALDRLPDSLIEWDPRLLVSSAWEYLFYGDYQEMMSLLLRAEALMMTPPWADVRDRLEAEIANMKARQAYADGDADAALAFARRAISDLPDQSDWLRGYAATAIGAAFNMTGNPAKGIEELNRLRRKYRAANGVFHTHVETGLTLIYLMQCNYPAMLESAEHLISLGKRHKLRFARLAGRYYAGWALYAQNEPKKAEVILSDALRDSGAAHSPYYAHTAFLLAFCYVALGDEINAQRVMNELQQLSIDYDRPKWTSNLQAFRLELAIRLGRKDTVMADRELAVAGGSDFRIHLCYNPLLTRIKTLLLHGEVDGVREAKALLDELRRNLSRINDQRSLLEAQALEAIIHDAMGNRVAALEVLRSALVAAGGVTRTFLDLGEPMAELLQALPRDARAGGRVERSLAALAAAHSVPNLTATDAYMRPESPILLPEALSRRELEVLSLLGNRLRDKEIARELDIAPGTVKSHLKSLFRKLDVGDRLEAAAKARALGL
jgi:LuxR family maltose regulon positive regulatory protein